MEKTKLGISVGLFGAIIFAVALFGGYIPSILLVGYVLLMETNEWLRKSAVKALATLADSLHIPVIASGGLVTGAQAAAALVAGASAVELGTAF